MGSLGLRVGGLMKPFPRHFRFASVMLAAGLGVAGIGAIAVPSSAAQPAPQVDSPAAPVATPPSPIALAAAAQHRSTLLMGLNEWPPPPPPPPAPVARSGSVQDAIATYFGDVYNKALSVARCESSLNPRAVSPGGGNYGLFQINVVHKGLVASMGYSWSQIFDPYVNAAVARSIYNSSGWGPWACA